MIHDSKFIGNNNNIQKSYKNKKILTKNCLLLIFKHNVKISLGSIERELHQIFEH